MVRDGKKPKRYSVGRVSDAMKKTPLKRTGLKNKPRKRISSRSKSKKVAWRSKADALWQQVIKLTWGGRCAMCGSPTDAAAGHHLIRRAIYHLRHIPANGLWLCNHCHNQADKSPHAHPDAFWKWLAISHPEIMDWVDFNMSSEGSEPDYKEVCEVLRARIKELQ